jgi:hypothetical protein
MKDNVAERRRLYNLSERRELLERFHYSIKARSA